MAEVRVNPSSELRRVALEEFATHGFEATSIQRIAERAGYTKQNVLYHFGSKRELFRAALEPSLDEFEALVAAFRAGANGGVASEAAALAFVTQLVRFMHDHRHEVTLYIRREEELPDEPVVHRARALIEELSELFRPVHGGSVEDRMRFSIGLYGTAYLLSSPEFAELSASTTPDQTRETLTGVLLRMIQHPAPTAAN